MHKTQKKLEEVQFFSAIQSYTNVGYTKTRELTVLTLLDKVIKLKHKSQIVVHRKCRGKALEQRQKTQI